MPRPGWDFPTTEEMQEFYAKEGILDPAPEFTDTLFRNLDAMRARVQAEILRFPAPAPLKEALREVDGILDRTNAQIRSALYARFGRANVP